MSTPAMTAYRTAGAPAFRSRIAGVFYLFNILTGASAAILIARGFVVYGEAANMVATACYIVVTVLFYGIFRPVSRKISLLAALFSFAGCFIGVVSLFVKAAGRINPLIFFGFYCLLIGYLILKSTLLPRILGLLMAFAGFGWLTFLWPPLAHSLAPYNVAPGVIGELTLTVWLLVKGVCSMLEQPS